MLARVSMNKMCLKAPEAALGASDVGFAVFLACLWLWHAGFFWGGCWITRTAIIDSVVAFPLVKAGSRAARETSKGRD